jgi:hypothetical protein
MRPAHVPAQIVAIWPTIKCPLMADILVSDEPELSDSQLTSGNRVASTHNKLHFICFSSMSMSRNFPNATNCRANTSVGVSPDTFLLNQVVGGSMPLPWFGDQLWLCGLIPHSALVGVREREKLKKKIALQVNCNCHLPTPIT